MRRFNFFLIGGKVDKLYPVTMLVPIRSNCRKALAFGDESEVDRAVWRGKRRAFFDDETQNGGQKRAAAGLRGLFL
jgi:hypothetical protein